MITVKNYINHRLVGSEKLVEIINPFDESVCGKAYCCSENEAEDSLNAARVAAETWKFSSINQRIRILEQVAAVVKKNEDELTSIYAQETGKSPSLARTEVQACHNWILHYGEVVKHQLETVIPDRDNRATHLLLREPIGVAVHATANNFPLPQLGFRVSATLATGNAGIFKPSEKCPLTYGKFADYLSQLDLLPGLINIVFGDPDEKGILIGLLAGSPIPRLLTLIGSTKAGLALIKLSTSNIKRFDLELGGNAPTIVFDDVDPWETAKQVVAWKLQNCGQNCTSPNRVFVHKKRYGEFITAAKSIMGSIKTRSTFDAEDGISPVVSETQLERLLMLIENAKEKGGRVVCGGNREDRKGYFLQPTLIQDVNRSMRLYREEIFGPICAVIPFNNEDDIWSLANDTEYGLAAYMFTNQYSLIKEGQQKLKFGTIGVNNTGLWSPYLPHGGLKQSGFGKSWSFLALDNYYDLKRVSIC